MMHTDTPWIGLVALIAMFVLPFLPQWLFEGRRTIKHHPRRHVCAECRAPWIDGHACTPGHDSGTEVLHGKLWRPSRSTALERRPHWGIRN
jgi:hypothetical protein